MVDWGLQSREIRFLRSPDIILSGSGTGATSWTKCSSSLIQIRSYDPAIFACMMTYVSTVKNDKGFPSSDTLGVLRSYKSKRCWNRTKAISTYKLNNSSSSGPISLILWSNESNFAIVSRSEAAGPGEILVTPFRLPQLYKTFSPTGQYLYAP